MKYFTFAALVALFVSCGIEDYPYLYPVPTGNVTNDFNYSATVIIPGDNFGNQYFTNYLIYYRIYISNYYTQSPLKDDNNYTNINTSLNTHHTQVEQYIGNDNMGSSQVASLFRNINYYSLALEGANIDNILSGGSGQTELVIDFSRDTETIPYLTIGGGTRYRLLRSIDRGNTPKPDNRYFLHTPDLVNEDNIASSVINSDISDRSSSTAERDYTYISMYIVATGIDPQTFTQIYSSPTQIGVLILPIPD